ncbi:MAG: FKBP-type peptidyl-prolyl cis-trans isomerase [Balneolaceae bacterium]|nr:FKBP-type peptidyl-prolyl cis-trans isomerase [Balneolaceae bacterium]
MRNYLFATITLSALLLAATACDAPQQRASASLDSQLDSVSYSIGYLQGSGMAQEGMTDIDINNYLAGMQTALEQGDAVMEQFDMQMLIQQYLSDLQVQQSVRAAEDAERNKAEGEEFLAENAERDDVNVTDSGLQYRVIEEGTGDRPTAADEVEVHYTGTLIDGTVFDSSVERGEPARFPLGNVIEGWTEGLQLMTVGSTYEFFIPSNLGYGDAPRPGSPIPPGAVLIFEVELLDIH